MMIKKKILFPLLLLPLALLPALSDSRQTPSLQFSASDEAVLRCAQALLAREPGELELHQRLESLGQFAEGRLVWRAAEALPAPRLQTLQHQLANCRRHAD